MGVICENTWTGVARLDGETLVRYGSVANAWNQVPFGVGIGGNRVGWTDKTVEFGVGVASGWTGPARWWKK